MSLSITPEIKQYRLALFVSKSLDDKGFLDDIFAETVATISHIHANGVNPLVAQFAADNGIPITIFPLTGGRSLPWATSNMLDNVDYAVIVSCSDSKSSAQVIEACKKKSVKFKEYTFNNLDKLRGEIEKLRKKADRVGELFAIMPLEDRERCEGWIEQIEKALGQKPSRKPVVEEKNEDVVGSEATEKS